MVSRYRRYIYRGSIALAVLVAGLLVFQACSGSGSGGAKAATGSPTGDTSPSATQVSSPELEGLLATTDLGVGPNRISFLLLTPDGLVTVPQVSVTSRYLPSDGSPAVSVETATARFHLWPFGVRGNYATMLSFDRPGDWDLDVKVHEIGDTVMTVSIPLRVKETSYTPAVGSRPPMVLNKTLADVDSLEELTSWPFADPEMYQLTIPEALATGKPLMLVFASPGICTSPTCGPQVDTILGLKEKYRGQVNFIHVEVYDNPEEIQTDLRLGRYAPAVEAWNLPKIEDYLNESWVFILDREGRIASKYEGYAPAEELEAGLEGTL
ncbi:MAG: thioredoxin family protein [Dehalococcoidia bacterium]